MLVVFVEIVVVDLHGIQGGGGQGTVGYIIAVAFVIGDSCSLRAKRREVSSLRGRFLA
jgi:hypothetical protein